MSGAEAMGFLVAVLFVAVIAYRRGRRDERAIQQARYNRRIMRGD